MDFDEHELDWKIVFDSIDCDGDDFELTECKLNVNEFGLPSDFPKDDEGYDDFD